MKIGIIVRTKFDPQYKEISTPQGRKLIETVIIERLKKLKPQHKYVLLDLHNLNMRTAKSCDLVWLAFEDFTNLLKEQIHGRSDKSRKSLATYEKTVENVLSIPKLYPPPKFLRFIHDKCQYYKWLNESTLPISPTVCVPTKRPGIDNVMKIMKKWPKTVFKPVLGGETKGFQIYEPPYVKSTVAKYFRDAGRAEYPSIIIQRFMPDFATRKYPEIRTIWVGDKLVYAVHTTGRGEALKLTKTVPRKIRDTSRKIIREIEKKYGFKMTSIRIDWGSTPEFGLFINEIENGYGTFADINPRLSGSLPDKIAERFIEVHGL